MQKYDYNKYINVLSHLYLKYYDNKQNIHGLNDRMIVFLPK